jgi:ATP-dependent helicase/nuclease subunit A
MPAPYGKHKLAVGAIESSLPDAVGAFVEWLVNNSGRRVTERGREGRVPIEARHVCIMFRRLDKMFGGDMTRAYMEALQARSISHVLVGGKSFHDREEVETMRNALSAIEWPDDALSVLATLRGSSLFKTQTAARTASPADLSATQCNDQRLTDQCWFPRFGHRIG